MKNFCKGNIQKPFEQKKNYENFTQEPLIFREINLINSQNIDNFFQNLSISKNKKYSSIQKISIFQFS